MRIYKNECSGNKYCCCDECIEAQRGAEDEEYSNC